MAIAKKAVEEKPKTVVAPAKKAPAAKKEPGKAVAVKKPTAIVSASVFEEDAQIARGQFGKEDLLTPWLRVLQALSPQTQKKGEGYVEGAEPGMFIDTSDNELWDGEEGILVIPVHYTPDFTEWNLREKGGGLVKLHGPSAPDIPTTRDDKNRDITPSGTQIVKSGLYFLFVVNEETGAYKPVAYPMQGAQLKKSRAWNSRMQAIKVPSSSRPGAEFTPAPFYTSWRLSTQYEKNDAGEWFGVKIESHKPTIELASEEAGAFGANLYLAAKEYKDLIAKGRVKTAVAEQEIEAEEVSDATAENEAY